eukprot:1189617-Prorocentrum_minimum.AAC.5
MPHRAKRPANTHSSNDPTARSSDLRSGDVEAEVCPKALKAGVDEKSSMDSLRVTACTSFGR